MKTEIKYERSLFCENKKKEMIKLFRFSQNKNIKSTFF
jgi:hypothetical protein